MRYHIMTSLKKDICKRCYVNKKRKWNMVDDLLWTGMMAFKKVGKLKPLVKCAEADWRAIPADEGIPTDCPYHLEHFMRNTTNSDT